MSLAKIDMFTCKPSHYASKRTNADGNLMARLHARRLMQKSPQKGINQRTYAFMDHMVSHGKLTAGPLCGWPSEKRADELNSL